MSGATLACDHDAVSRGVRDPQVGITKAGNVYLRSLLIECAGHILRPQGKDSSLRQWGLHLASRGGKQARNKAVVAVARKLAVLPVCMKCGGGSTLLFEKAS